MFCHHSDSTFSPPPPKQGDGFHSNLRVKFYPLSCFSLAQQVAVIELEEPDGWVDIDTLDKDERSVNALYQKMW